MSIEEIRKRHERMLESEKFLQKIDMGAEIVRSDAEHDRAELLRVIEKLETEITGLKLSVEFLKDEIKELRAADRIEELQRVIDAVENWHGGWHHELGLLPPRAVDELRALLKEILR